jgi:hypothetical protein
MRHKEVAQEGQDEGTWTCASSDCEFLDLVRQLVRPMQVISLRPSKSVRLLNMSKKSLTSRILGSDVRVSHITTSGARLLSHAQYSEPFSTSDDEKRAADFKYVYWVGGGVPD